MASLSLNYTANAVLLALFTAGLLTACGGGGGGTTRTGNTDNGTTTPETTYKLIVSSPVPVKNVNVRVISLDNTELAKGTISDGSSISFEIKKSDIGTGRLLIAEFTPQGANSSYYDPVLDKSATFDATLHRIFAMSLANTNADVNPFTEIAYQRFLVRAGSMDRTLPNLKNRDTASIIQDISNSNLDIQVTFRIGLKILNSTIEPEFPLISARSNYAKLIYKQGVANPPNSQPQYVNSFFAMGHYLVQHNLNPADQTPYLTFTKRAAEDMRDGSLDGLTVFGDGTNGKPNSNILNNPLIGPAPLNINPAYNIIRTFNADTTKDESNKSDTIKGTQKLVRETYATALQTNIHDFMHSLTNPDVEGLTEFDSFNYKEGISLTDNNFTQPPIRLHSFGAGNYNRAFGIQPVTIPKDTWLYVLDDKCIPQYTLGTEDADKKPVPVVPGCMVGVNADGGDEGSNSTYNAVQSIVGTYTSTDNCKLVIDFKGNVSLSKGELFSKTTINRGEYDSIIQIGNTTDNFAYLLNVASADTSPVEFIQVKVVNGKVMSATAGTSTDDNKYPKVLSNQKLSCSFNYGS